jgi:2-polyprenyl-6-methoxyphenol hydroxylase-like FAD-dependent oxidoreductase
MHDALVLANLLYALPPNYTSTDIEQLFSEYRTERLPIVQATFKNSQMMSKATDKGLFATCTRFILRHMPTWLWSKFLERMVVDRPQAGFLKQVEAKGTVVPSVSPSTLKARAVYEQNES